MIWNVQFKIQWKFISFDRFFNFFRKDYIRIYPKFKWKLIYGRYFMLVIRIINIIHEELRKN